MYKRSLSLERLYKSSAGQARKRVAHGLPTDTIPSNEFLLRGQRRTRWKSATLDLCSKGRPQLSMQILSLQSGPLSRCLHPSRPQWRIPRAYRMLRGVADLSFPAVTCLIEWMSAKAISLPHDGPLRKWFAVSHVTCTHTYRLAIRRFRCRPLSAGTSGMVAHPGPEASVVADRRRAACPWLRVAPVPSAPSAPRDGAAETYGSRGRAG